MRQCLIPLEWLSSGDNRGLAVKSWAKSLGIQQQGPMSCVSTDTQDGSDRWRTPLPGRGQENVLEILDFASDKEWRENETLELVSVSGLLVSVEKQLILHVEFYYAASLTESTNPIARWVWKGITLGVLVRISENSWGVRTADNLEIGNPPSYHEYTPITLLNNTNIRRHAHVKKKWSPFHVGYWTHEREQLVVYLKRKGGGHHS